MFKRIKIVRILLLCLIALIAVGFWLCTPAIIATAATVLLFFTALIVIFYDNDNIDWDFIDPYDPWDWN